MGIINEVVPASGLQDAVAHWCSEILKAAPSSIRATKEAAMRGLDEPSLEAAIKAQATYPTWIAHRGSHDAREGPLAFAEKRPPQWTGR